MNNLRKILSHTQYDLTRTIAEGGMGTVYEAQQHGCDEFTKTVAIKVILKEYSKIAEFRANFIGEARLVADLIHTNIVQTYNLGVQDGLYYIVMEYVNGVTLEDFLIRHLETKQAVPVELAVFVISRICRGLAYAHQKTNKNGELLGIVHRDVNPRNIMLAREGAVKLTDFGIAKARDLMYNKEGEVIAGKDEYLSPEQALKQVTDARADLFSCGIVLSELLLGYNVFEGDDERETRENVVRGRLPNFSDLNSNIDSKLNDILHKALQKKREDRYQDATEMLTELELYLYSDGYGPTNEKLAIYLNDIFDEEKDKAALRWEEGIREQLTRPGLVQ